MFDRNKLESRLNTRNEALGRRLDKRRKAAERADRWFAGLGCLVLLGWASFWGVIIWAIVRLVLEYT